MAIVKVIEVLAQPHALIAQTVLAWTVLPVSYFFTNPAENINWVFGFKKGEPQTRLPPLSLNRKK